MNKYLVLLLITLCIYGCKKNELIKTTKSPNGMINLEIDLDETGQPFYKLNKNGRIVLEESSLGLESKEADLSKGLILTKTEVRSFDETWTPSWGQNASIKNKYNELKAYFENKDKEKIVVVFRLYDEGLGFRYDIPASKKNILNITADKSSFNFLADHNAFWVPGCWDNDEYPYTESKISKIDASYFIKGYKNAHASTITNKNSVNTPVTLITEEGVHLSVHEAALIDFPGMSLLVDTATFSFSSHLAESDSSKGIKATIKLPFSTPWRTLTLTDDAAGLISSNLIQNLNEPSKIKDVSWITPTKYMGIWWEMHVGKAAWDLKSGKHGANTANIKSYIDFCSESGIKGLLIEGWNTGWEDWVGEEREGIFDFVTPYQDCNMTEIVAYAKAKGVQIIGHHETAAAVNTYEKHMEAGYQYYNKLGITAVKTGYVGKIKGHRHYDQRMVNHYNKTMEQTAKYKIMLNIHEPIKPTGLNRTYPHLMSGEGMRGQEFNAWSEGNNPSHNVTLPFTRNLAGPMDFTPGIFDLKLEKYKNNVTKVASFDDRAVGEKPYSRVYSTLAHQLALYVVFYSPIQMAADLPENYKGHPAFQFIKDVGVDWELTRVLYAKVGQHVVTMRKEKGSKKWFVGGISGMKPYKAKVKFDFLPKGESFTAIIYKDASDTDYLTSPEKYEIIKRSVTSGDTIDIDIKAAGGFAISIL